MAAKKVTTETKATGTVQTASVKAETRDKEPVTSSTTEKAPKKASVKKELKVKAVVEYYGKQVSEKEIIANVKKAWTKSGKKVGEIKTMDLYIKPEENAVYYVINGTVAGAVAFSE